MMLLKNTLVRGTLEQKGNLWGNLSPHKYTQSALNAGKAHATAQRTFLARGSRWFIESLGREALSS